MAKVALTIYTHPGALEITCNLNRADGGTERLSAYVDTGAHLCLFPLDLLSKLKVQQISEAVTIEQAGIAKQEFQAVEAYVEVFFEDRFGVVTRPYRVRAWFADTETYLIGFDGVLDQATLHVDLRGTRDAWIELDDA